MDVRPLDCKEIQPVHSEGDQPGISLEGMMLKFLNHIHGFYYHLLFQQLLKRKQSQLTGGVLFLIKESVVSLLRFSKQCDSSKTVQSFRAEVITYAALGTRHIVGTQ